MAFRSSYPLTGSYAPLTTSQYSPSVMPYSPVVAQAPVATYAQPALTQSYVRPVVSQPVAVQSIVSQPVAVQQVAV
jgi:hypothetical protein